MRFTRQDPSFLTKWFFEIDRSVLVAVLLLTLAGLLTLVPAGSNLPPLYFLLKFLPHLFLGLTALFIFSNLSPKWIKRISIVLGIAFALLTIATILPPINPDKVKGSYRFLKFLGIMPSEFLKPFFIVITASFLAHISQFSPAHFFSNKKLWHLPFLGSKVPFAGEGVPAGRGSGNRMPEGISESLPEHFLNTSQPSPLFTWPLYLLFALPPLLAMFLQPDFGMTLIYCAVFASMLFFAGTSWKSIAASVPVAAVIGALAFFTMPHVRARLLGLSDPFQINRALDSIRNGGMFGQLSSSFVKSNLPDAHTDFVFASFLEDYGLVIGLLLLALFFWLIFHLLDRMKKSKDTETKLILGGTAALLGTQMFLNIGTTLNLGFTKGTVLPFISYGGSAYVAMCIMIGIVLSVLRKNN
ncbi:MAG: FtsW/RodA/SpoVE family cell cycle protein [Rickettsiales bacterium]|jgi:cell division protein FtsW|nr:FtsW/RodA/SpoVE family cell cycle protein [Rickettsiales bacterium]